MCAQLRAHHHISSACQTGDLVLTEVLCIGNSVGQMKSVAGALWDVVLSQWECKVREKFLLGYLII